MVRIISTCNILPFCVTARYARGIQPDPEESSSSLLYLLGNLTILDFELLDLSKFQLKRII